MDPNEPPVRKIFGLDAIETADSLTIAKTNMYRLVPALANTAESMFVGIVLTAAEALRSGDYANDPTGSVTIEFPTFTEVGKRQIVITLTEKVPNPPEPTPLPPEAQSIDPNKY